jgi:hypothetical protein
MRTLRRSIAASLYDRPMRIRQHVSFGLSSTTLPAAEMAARLGLEPDRVLVRGSRYAEPPMPLQHSWQVTCAERGRRVDEQIERLVARLEPIASVIGALALELERDNGCGSWLSVVRHFDAEDGEEEQPSPPDAPLRKLPGQHQLLGWHLERRVMDFLVATRAELDVDEYG